MTFELHCPETCPFVQRCERNPVMPDGNKNGLLVIGEAPGKDEAKAGHGFAGIAGKNLYNALTKCIYDKWDLPENRDKCLFPIPIARANAVLCHPVDVENIISTKGNKKFDGQITKNRKPTKAEIQACSKNLRNAIDYYQPKVIIAVGKTAFESLGYSTEPYDFIEFCYFGIPFLQSETPKIIPIPHTSPLSWNMSTSGIKHKDIGITNIRKALEYFND